MGGTKSESIESNAISKAESVSLEFNTTAIVETAATPIIIEEPASIIIEEPPTTAIVPPTVLEEPSIPLAPTETPPTVPVDRSDVAAPGVDLSGDWTILVSDEFKAEYDEYLKQLGQPMLVRSIALGIIGMTTEYTLQTNEGRELLIRGTNARGVWERSLTANNRITTADAELVEATSWWEDDGVAHRSWLKGVTKYGGGDFESKRYLDPQNKNVLVTESTFHPADPSRGPVKVTWRFLRKGVELTA